MSETTRLQRIAFLAKQRLSVKEEIDRLETINPDCIIKRLSSESRLMLHWLKRCSMPMPKGPNKNIPDSIACMWSAGDYLVSGSREGFYLTERGKEVEQYLTETETETEAS